MDFFHSLQILGAILTLHYNRVELDRLGKNRFLTSETAYCSGITFAVVNELDRVLTNKRLLFRWRQKPPICSQQKTETFICDKFMLINIDKLLALLLLTFSPSKVGLRPAMTKPWFSVCLFHSQHPDQLSTWLGWTVRREKGVKTSVGWLWVTLGTSRNGRRDTVLCIMDRVPGTSGIPRQAGGWRETDRDLPSRVMRWMSILANQRPCNTVDQPIRGLLHRIQQSTIKQQQSKSKITWIETVEHQSMFYKMHSNLWAMRQKKACAPLGVHLWTLWDVQRQEIKEDQLMVGLRFMIISCPGASPGLARAYLEISSFRCIKKDCVSTL